jgi:uncharacterized membrane protein YphA (DoxX/SURF4 family)
MSVQTTESSHPSLSHADSIAASTTDAFLLVGRVLIGWLFLVSSAGIGGKLWNIAGFAAYLKNLGVPAPVPGVADDALDDEFGGAPPHWWHRPRAASTSILG